MTVGISELSREATPISSLTWLEDGPTSPFGLAENPLHLRLAVDIDGQAHFPEPLPVTSRKLGVGGKQMDQPQSEDRTDRHLLSATCSLACGRG